jgi:two-component system, cell cycle sensor histidine kinase and response regulator CckA
MARRGPQGSPADKTSRELAHDLINLLTAILGQCDLLLLRLSHEDPTRPTIEVIRAAGRRAEEVTRRLLAESQD